jgi:predicted dehydrogenase
MAGQEKGRDDGVDAVMITTPNNMHYTAAKIFLDAGIDVICDKPLTNTIEEASLLGDVVSKSDRVFAVCYTMSCYPMIRQAQEIVASGVLGRINQIHVEFMQDWMTPPDAGDAPHVKWRLDPAVSGPTSCVGDIGTHAAHLAQFVSGLGLQRVRADFHVCGSPKPLEDTVFMMTEYEGGVPGTLMATRQAPGNRGGLRLRLFGSLGGLEWDMENAEQLRLNIFGEPDQILSRGHGHGLSKQTERFVRTGRGFPEGLIEAWANLYTEFAVAIAARRDQIDLPDTYLRYPKISEGIDGVRFVDACVRSNSSKEWAHL